MKNRCNPGKKTWKNDTAEIPHHLSKVIKNIWVSSNSEVHWIPKSIISWDLKKNGDWLILENLGIDMTAVEVF